MATMNLAPPTGAVPRLRIEVFNTLLSCDEAMGQDVDINYDQRRCGWLTITDEDISIFSFVYDDDICRIPTGRMAIAEEDMWLFGLEIIQRPTAAIYLDGTINEDPVNQPGDPSYLLVCVDNVELEDHAVPVGTMWIYGVYEEPIDGGGYESHYITEFIDINGPGSYKTVNQFTRVANMATDFADDGSHCTVSVWGKCGTAVGRRECRVWIDGNGDGVFGLVHSGYIAIGDMRPTYGRTDVVMDLVGYQFFLQTNEYTSGYRAAWRCRHYLKTGESGTCDVDSANFRTSSSACFIGDLGCRHPSNLLASTACPDYNPGDATTIEYLPYDGWTYYKDYAPTTEAGYEYCPPNYFRAVQAACNMANSYERGKPVSRPWTMYSRYVCTLVTEMESNSIYVDTDMSFSEFDVEEFSYLIIDDEIICAGNIYEGNDGSARMAVTRGAMNTVGAFHPVGSVIYIPYTGMSEGHNGAEIYYNPLCLMGQLTVPDTKSSIATTLDKLAQNAAVVIGDAEYMAWTDKFKQIHFQEFSQPSAGSSETGGESILTIREIDIVDRVGLNYSPVVNQVSARILLADGNVIVAKLAAEDIGVTGYDLSVKYFGRVAREETNPQLNSYGPVEGKTDFLTWATNYLRLRAFPVLIQEICVFGFVPDEHYWQDVQTNNELTLPYLKYTDLANHHIDLRGTKVTCPDYFLPKIDGVSPQVSEFVVQAVETRFEPPGNLRTWLTLRRYTRPEDYQ